LARKIGEAFIRVRPDTARFGKDAHPGVKRAGQSAAKSFGGGFSTVVKGVLGAAVIVAAGRAAKAFAVDIIAAGRDNVRVAKLTEAAIKSTGGAANVSAKQVGQLANKLSAMSGVAASSLQPSQSLLLTFTNIRNVGVDKIFDQAATAAVDMTAALNNGEVTTSGLKSSTIQLGKALNDPIKGVTALQRVGVSFTKGQREQIAAMVEAGDVAGAQKLILAELSKEFGGAAKAAADPAQRARAVWENFKGTLGERFLPVLAKLADVFATKVQPVLEQKILPAVGRLGRFIGGEVVPRVREVADTWLPRLAAAFRNVAGFLTGTVVPALSTLAGFISRNREFFIPFVAILGAALVAFKAFMFIRTLIAAVWAFNVALAANPIGIVIVAIAALVAGFIYAYKNSETFRRIVDGVFRAIVTVVRWWFENVVKRYIAGVVAAFRFVVEWAKKLWRGVQLYFGFWRGLLSAVVGWVVGVKNRIVANFTAVVNFIKRLPGRVRSAASGLFDGIRSAFRSALNWIIDKWNSLGFTLPVIEFLGKTIGGNTFRVPQIPRFHSGGIVPGIGDQLIVARPGEGVFTRDQMAALAPAGTAGVTVENMTIQAWSDRFSLRQVRDELALHGVV
jgi:hypothetical protein